jgi:hypothetical protein
VDREKESQRNYEAKIPQQASELSHVDFSKACLGLEMKADGRETTAAERPQNYSGLKADLQLLFQLTERS